MKVLLIRHAIAEDRAAFARSGRDDGLRPLTKRGKRKMRAAARGLRRVVPAVDLLSSSPLRRAAQTARIVADAYGGGRDEHEGAKAAAKAARRGKPRRAEVAALAPGKSLKDLLHWLQSQPPGVTVALVGHEPHLGTFASWLLTGLQESFVPMKKGAACLLEFKKDVKAGRAALVWALRPAQLRALGKAAAATAT